jgi:ring-1,2-phenylacetyl-CoA epoxidase subunit PaaE
MINNVLNNEPLSSFELIYGNKSQSSVMFHEEISSLLTKFPERFILRSLYSRENITGTINGRIDEYSLKKLFDDNSNLLKSDAYYICGPGNMIDNVKNFLDLNSIDSNKINFELFTSPDLSESKKENSVNKEIISNVTICVDGDDFEFELSSNGATILDAAIETGADVPFSCKGGVCSVCKAKVMEGSAKMDMNYSLSEDDVEEGFILTCQAHPSSDNIYVDYDEM